MNTPDPPGRIALRARRVRQLGQWGTRPWLYLRSAGEAVKRFTWDLDVRAVATDRPVALHYSTRATLRIDEMEDLARVERAERDARELLERAAGQVLDGVGYITPVLLADFVEHAVEGLLADWWDSGSDPEDWRDEVHVAVDQAVRAYEAALEAARQLGAQPEPDPVLAVFGWRVAVRLEPTDSRPPPAP